MYTPSVSGNKMYYIIFNNKYFLKRLQISIKYKQYSKMYDKGNK